MKNCLQSITLTLLSLLFVLSLSSCTLNIYDCEVLKSESLDFIDEKNYTDNYVIKIGQSTFNARYISSKKSNLTNETFDIYGIVEESSDIIRKRIRVNSKTGVIVGFSNINPYPNIDNIDKLSDDELRETVELMMDGLADFKQYNEFEIKRPHSSNSVYYLKWQVKRDLLCNIKTEIYITTDGSITSFDRTDACPSDLTTSFVNNTKRDELIKKKIKAYLGVDSVKAVTYEVQEEVLTYYDNVPAIIYNVKVVENGFEQTMYLVVCKRTN